MESNENKKKTMILTIIAVSCLLIVVIGATYAYFQVLATNNVTGTNTQGSADTMPKGTLVTNITALKINLDADLMSEERAGVTYYATESGVPVTSATEGSGKYVLATASLNKEGLTYDCGYSYIVTATKKKDITDGSDADVKIRITGSDGYTETYTLQEILNNGSKTYSGKIKGLTYGENQKIYVEAYVENANKAQDDLAGNEFTFTLALVENSFKCDLPLDIEKEAKGKDFAQFLVDNNTRVDGLWSSGLEGDGYRYTGTGVTCSYDEGNYIGVADNQYTTPSCPTLYNYTRTTISSGATRNYTYQTSCPSDSSTYTYSCTELAGTLDSSNVPNNFICFGTSDKTECKNNEAKYMYRIIGVFEGTDGNQHLKLISLKQLGSYRWNDTNAYVNWGSSTLFTGLNGNYFLTNTTYDYLQNNTWLNKIEDWTWSAVNTRTISNSGPDYYSITTQEMYLHEMNRSSKTSSIGEWSTPTAKIGLMYASDYQMSLGSSSLNYTGDDYATLKTGWMHQSNNDTTSSSAEWTLSYFNSFPQRGFMAWYVFSDGFVGGGIVVISYGARPVFHLTSDTRINGGNGEYENPYILE